MTYQEACDEARYVSKSEHCTKHVNATLIKPASGRTGVEPKLDENGYTVSNWYDGSTVASFSAGAEL
jgi:hypothetical protein